MTEIIMDSFANFSLTEQKNTHMTHLEDKVIYGGADGTRQAINALRDLRNMLAGKKKGSIFAGIDPTDGKFFVAKKSIFNKNPKVYKSPEDIDSDTSGDLNDKLQLALQYLPELGIKGVIQGDFLYKRSELKTKTIGTETFVTFHPNTLVYAVPIDQAKVVLASKIGIVWHTTYKGSSFESMSASYGVDVSKLNKSKNVWSQDAVLRDVSNATMTNKETETVNEYLTQIGNFWDNS